MKIYSAEELNYWQTSRSSPDSWIDKAKRQIQSLGGKVEAEGFGQDSEGKAAFMIGFSLNGDGFKIIWPVMKSKTGNERAARIQAATSLYHYVKGVCLYAAVVGPKPAFFGHLMLPDGKIASQLASDKLAEMIPRIVMIENKGR